MDLCLYDRDLRHKRVEPCFQQGLLPAVLGLGFKTVKNENMQC